MMILGLTGGVGAGKSRILELFSHDYGAQVIQADLVARKLEDPGQPGLTGLVSLFGTGILQKRRYTGPQGLRGQDFWKSGSVKTRQRPDPSADLE